jgi:hypothetical protein
MNDTIKIVLTDIKSKNKEQKPSCIPEEYIEILPKYIKIYQGCWIRYTSKETGENYSGGYLIEVTGDNEAVMRNIKREVYEKKIDDYIFYCKNDVPNHQAVKSIVEERDKLSLKIKEFNIEKQKLNEKMKKYFLM